MERTPLVAATDTARSVRPLPENGGLLRVDENCSRPATCTSSSHCPTTWRHWCCRTKRSSTISCFAPVRKHFRKLRVIRDTSVRKLASSACCIPGVSSSTLILMSIALFLPVAFPSITPAGFAHERTTSFPRRCYVKSFVASSLPPSSRPSVTVSSTSMAT